MTADLQEITMESVGQLLGDLLGVAVRTSQAKKLRVRPKASVVVCEFAFDDDSLAALVVCDANAASMVGAALSRIPVDTAKQCASSGKLSAEIRDNLSEVLNVSAALLNDACGNHVRMKGLHETPPVPDELSQTLTKPATRFDFTVNVDRYGEGKMSFLFA